MLPQLSARVLHRLRSNLVCLPSKCDLKSAVGFAGRCVGLSSLPHVGFVGRCVGLSLASRPSLALGLLVGVSASRWPLVPPSRWVCWSVCRPLVPPCLTSWLRRTAGQTVRAVGSAGYLAFGLKAEWLSHCHCGSSATHTSLWELWRLAIVKGT